MFDSRRKSVRTKMKNHFAFTDFKDNRIECFTNLDTSTYDKDVIVLRMGQFTLTRNDNDRGPRYFINDYRDATVEPNAVAIFNEKLRMLVEKHEVLPLLTRDDLNVYQIGDYYHPQDKKKLVITATGVHEETVSA